MDDVGERWRLIRHALACRSDHRCELCGVRLGPGEEGTAHHRRPRKRGGTRKSDVDSLANLLLLCGGRLGGVAGCHGRVEERHREVLEADPYETGWLVREGADPARVPVVVHGGRLVRLHPEQPFYLDPPGGPVFAATTASGPDLWGDAW